MAKLFIILNLSLLFFIWTLEISCGEGEYKPYLVNIFCNLYLVGISRWMSESEIISLALLFLHTFLSKCQTKIYNENIWQNALLIFKTKFQLIFSLSLKILPNLLIPTKSLCTSIITTLPQVLNVSCNTNETTRSHSSPVKSQTKWTHPT